MVLTRNPDAVQIGLTATPRQLEITEHTKEAEADAQITADNIHHFGEPVYEYDMAQGIEDGYLAACEIRKSRVNLDDTGITIDDILARNPVNAITGQPVTASSCRRSTTRPTSRTAFCCPIGCWRCPPTSSTNLLEPAGRSRRRSSSACATATPTTWRSP